MSALEVFILIIVGTAIAVVYSTLKKQIGINDNEINAVNDKTDELSAYTRTSLSESEAQYENMIAGLEKKIDSLANYSESLGTENKQLKAELAELRKKLNFYANIEEDSADLNVQEDEEERARCLEEARKEILKDREARENNYSNQSEYPEEISQDSQNSFISSTEKESNRESDTGNTGEVNALDPEQKKVSRYMDGTNENIFITGKAGTGKSFLLDAFRETTNKSHVVAAPTGIAAINVKGSTLHSIFGYGNLQRDINEISEETIKLKSEKRMVLKNVDTIIIDEISMVRADVFDRIDKILKVINKNDKPFGGKQMLIFGDLFQLPPVAQKVEKDYLDEIYGGSYFFYSNAYKNGNFKFAELTINHRQKNDTCFFDLLNRIRLGEANKEDIDLLNSRYDKDGSAYNRYTTLLPKKDDAESVNKDNLSKLGTKEYTYQAEIVLNKKANKTNIESTFPISETLKLKKGALVMMVANDAEHRWVNGTLGIINSLSEDRISVSINKKTYDVAPINFTEQEITYSDGKIKYEDVLKIIQYPLVLAYAITIHKSQGKTYNNIVCDIEECFADGQAYVALSRCSSLNGLHLKNRITGSSIRANPEVVDFYNQQQSNGII